MNTPTKREAARVIIRLAVGLSPLVVLGASMPSAEHIKAGESLFSTIVNSGALGILAFFYIVEIGVREWNRYQDRIAAKERAKVMAQREKEYKDSEAALHFVLQAFIDVVNSSAPEVAAEIAKRRANGHGKDATQRIGIHVR